MPPAVFQPATPKLTLSLLGICCVNDTINLVVVT